MDGDVFLPGQQFGTENQADETVAGQGDRKERANVQPEHPVREEIHRQGADEGDDQQARGAVGDGKAQYHHRQETDYDILRKIEQVSQNDLYGQQDQVGEDVTLSHLPASFSTASISALSRFSVIIT